MIEWVEVKEFLDKVNIEQEEYFLLYNIKNNNITTASLLTCSTLHIPTRFTHAAKINLPVEKTLEEKFKDWAKENKVLSSPAYFPILAQIAKEHYEGGK